MTSRSSVSAVADQGFHLMNEAKEVWEAVSRTFAVTDDGDGIWSRIRDHLNPSAEAPFVRAGRKRAA